MTKAACSVFGETKVNKELLLKIIDTHHLTEQTYALQEKNIYFKVKLDATKKQIKAAIETVFAVKVASVNTNVYKPVVKRTMRGVGSTKAFKKAMVPHRGFFNRSEQSTSGG